VKAIPRLVYLLVFIGLTIVAVLALNRIVQPSAATLFVRTVFVAAICGAPGLVWRRLWPLAILLVPIGCYLLLRTTIPLPASVEGIGTQYHFYTQQLQLGVTAYKNLQFPIPVDEAPEFRLLVSFVVYWLTAAAAFLALSLRRPLPAVVIVLVVLGFGVTVDGSVRVLWPALLFVILAGCLFVLSRALERERWRLRNVVAGSAVGVVASLLALGLLVAVPSVVAKPWQDWRIWDPFNREQSTYTFNWLQNYPKLLDPANNMLFMRVESPSPSYWRASALDSFTGTAWVTSRAFIAEIDPASEPESQDTTDLAGYSYTYDIPTGELMPEGTAAVENFDIQSVYTNYFFTGGDPEVLGIDQNIALRMNDMGSLRVSTALGPTLRYSLVAIIPKLAPTDLVGLGADYSGDLDSYLTLPFSRLADIGGPDKGATWHDTMDNDGPDGLEWMDLYDLNQGIIGDATDPYEITLRIERYLRRFYTYSLTPPASDFSSPYAAFLFDTRSGYCQHFAGAMALLLRYNSIPARVAVGFATGETDGPAAYLVSTNNAHAWVEVYFPTVGWVAFDPTPGHSLPVSGASSTSPGFVNPFVDNTSMGSGTVDTEPPQSNRPNGEETGGQTGGSEGPGWLSKAAWLPWVATIAVIAIGWPIVRMLWRRRGIHRGTLPQRLQASLTLLRADLSDNGVPVSASDTLEDVFRALKTHAGLEPNPVFLDRADAVLFGGRDARANDLRQAETLRREAKARLRKRRGWARTGLAWYGVRRLSLGGTRDT
jgi:protein-glutamine gamma-glutamyltransferase